MKNRTVNEAIIEVLKKERKSLSAKEIYSKIIEGKLYNFKSVTPVHIVLTQLRRRCEGINLKTSYQIRYYRLMPDGTYALKV